METIKIKGNTQAAKKFIEFAKTMSFVEFVKKSPKKKILSEIEKGLKEVKKMQEGKLKMKTLNDLLNGQ